MFVVGFPDPVIQTYTAELGKKMIKSCGGLPLAVIVLGGLLATKQTTEEWDDVHTHRDGHTHWVMDIQPYPIQLFWVIPNS